jgi:hypothetical protein
VTWPLLEKTNPAALFAVSARGAGKTTPLPLGFVSGRKTGESTTITPSDFKPSTSQLRAFLFCGQGVA